ncbi:MAG: hypothetical protein Q9196_004536 [Gyalolechia fulgens]
MLKARHKLIVTAAGAPIVYTKADSRVLESNRVVSIGNCLYEFTQTALMASLAFRNELNAQMKTIHGPQWTTHPLVSSATSEGHLAIGGYACLPGAFAQGTFGEVTSGWASDGTAVAIKRFKAPRKEAMEGHRMIMTHIGEHPNILSLRYYLFDPTLALPGAYCIYTPLATGSLSDVITTCDANDEAYLTLFNDFLQGLDFLHSQKGVMHRDLNPNNLGVVSFNPPKGVLLDLDSATLSETSSDHMQGTIRYLAPEIIDLKGWLNPPKGVTPPYSRAVDIWALGLSVYTAIRGPFWSWASFASRGKGKEGFNAERHKAEPDYVQESTYSIFRKDLQGRRFSDARRLAFWVLVEDMTRWIPSRRPTAAEALATVRSIPRPLGEGTISAKSGTKRKRSNDSSQALV